MKPIAFIQIMSSILFLMTGCGKTDKPSQRLDLLADTVWAGENREVFMSTGSGAYYYADALGEPKRYHYGFSVAESLLLAEWTIVGENGAVLNTNPEYALVHPEFCVRRYSSGLIEKIETIPDLNGLYVTFTLAAREPISLRLWQHPQLWQQSAVAFSRTTQPRPLKELKNVDYPHSRRRGEPAETELYCSEEYLIDAKEFSFAYLFDGGQHNSGDLAKESIAHPPKWRARRREISLAALGAFDFACERQEITRAIDWARLTLAALCYESEHGTKIFAGIPNSPLFRHFEMSYAAVGIGLTDSTRRRPISLMKTALDELETPDPSRSLTVAGVVAGELIQNWERILSDADTVPTGLNLRLLKMIDSSLTAELTSRNLAGGLMFKPGLFDQVGYPPRERQGAPIETQALLAAARNYLDRRNDLEGYQTATPDMALTGTTGWARPDIPYYAVGAENRMYLVPMKSETLVKFYQSRSGRPIDRIIFLSESEQNPGPFLDSTQTVAHILAFGWLAPDNKRLNDRLLVQAEASGLLTHYGFRSLASSDSSFQANHVYEMYGQPVGSVNQGDILVWTCGRLADMRRMQGSYEHLSVLAEKLSALMLDHGVVGALPEALNGEPDPEFPDITSNPVYSCSLAEFLRLFYDDILGIDLSRKSLPSFSPAIPARWGKISLNFRTGTGRVHLERDSTGAWEAVQYESEEPITFAVELHPEEGIRAIGSIILHQGERIRFKSTQTGENLWTISQKNLDE